MSVTTLEGTLGELVNQPLHEIEVEGPQIQIDRELMRIKGIFSVSSDAISIIDAQSMQFIYVNEAAKQRFGYSLEELIHLGPKKVIATDAIDLHLIIEEIIANNVEGTQREVAFVSKTGEPIPSAICGDALWLDGRWMIVTLTQDNARTFEKKNELRQQQEGLEPHREEPTRQLQLEIERRKELETILKLSEERFQDIVSSSTDGFWETDSGLEFTTIDPSFINVAGISSESFCNLTCQEFTEGVGSDENRQEHLDKLKNHQPFRNFQFRHQHPTEGYKYLSMSGIPVYDSFGNFTGYRGTGTDVTKQVEARLQAIKTQEELHLAKEEADKASLAKSEFLASMSHELRTPLNCILGFTQLLELSEENLDEQQVLHIRHILSSGEHLLNLVTDVLELNTIEEGRMSLQFDNVSTDDVISDCLSQIQFRANEKNIRLIDERDTQCRLPQLWSDITRVKQLLLNLLSNAVKYNIDGGHVTLSCRLMPNNLMRISIADSGAGIPDSQREDLFTPFERLGRETGPIEGTGIGLSITKRVVELLDGSIGYESKIGEGSTFWVELPISSDPDLRRTHTEHTASEVGLPASLQTAEFNHKSLLYIEDDPDNQSLMTHILAKLDSVELKMLTAHNAELGIDLACSHLPDIVILDINLPGMSGLEAVQKLKSMPETKDIPVIAMSADATPFAIKEAMNYGFEAYVTKPIKVKEIHQTISRLLATDFIH
jgi:PAS domain S-box-containing protein